LTKLYTPNYTNIMPITWIPVRGYGYWSKGKLIGEGQYINENDYLMEKGTFNQDGNLDAVECEVINYSDPANVSVRLGTYSDGKENGTIIEYVFAKSAWENFMINSSVSSTKYTHLFSNGVWESTSNTQNNISILGNFTRVDDKLSGFSIDED
jgi:hypothetical protein